MTLDILRESGGALSSRQVAEAMIRGKALELSAERIELFQKRALNVLNRLENKGLVVRRAAKGAPHTWEIV
jgi:hypothetical protein